MKGSGQMRNHRLAALSNIGHFRSLAWVLPGHGDLMGTDLRRRCAAALTHPVTLAALALLILNDLVFKALWPEAWATGKLSDLAWVVFASPLLAFLLSLVVPRSRRTAQGALLASYVGLPLLYLAFNTFGLVHDAIIGIFSLAHRGSSGSPLDPTDSLVILPGLAIAAWVWRRSGVNPRSLGGQWSMLVAGIAALSTVATSESAPDPGITQVGIATDGTVVAGKGNYRASLVSGDGGLTWEHPKDVEGVVKVDYGSSSVLTPRGTYVIEGLEVLRVTGDSQREPEYSFTYLEGDNNEWVQHRATQSLEGGGDITTAPGGLVYDEPTGNVIVAVGLQGVVVGTPEGRWSRIAVGPYQPIDFSIAAKLGLLFSDGKYWNLALALSLSVMGITLAVAEFCRGEHPGWATLALVSSIPALVAALVLLGDFGVPSRPDITGFEFKQVFGGVVAYFFAGLAMMPSLRQWKYWQGITAAFVGMHGLIVLALLWWLLLGLTLAMAKLAAFGFVVLVAVVLANYLIRKQRAEAASYYTRDT